MYQNAYGNEVAQWKVDLIVRRAKRMGFRSHDLDDIQQEIVLVVATFRFDRQRADQATEKTALTGLIDRQLKAMRRADARYRGRLRRIKAEKQHQSDVALPEQRGLLMDDVRGAIEQLPAEEQQICSALAEGDSPHAVAKKLGCSWHTVQRHILSIRSHFESLGLSGWLSS